MENKDTNFENSSNNSFKEKEKTIEDRLLLILNIIKQDIKDFIFKSIKKGFNFNFKLNEKKKKIKIFVSLINSSDTNNRNEDIDFLIETNEEYPEKAPMVFCLSCVSLILIFNVYNLV